MYKAIAGQPDLENFITPFDSTLKPDNHREGYSRQISWSAVQKANVSSMIGKMGDVYYNSRIAFGVLFIKNCLNITDEETVEQIRENYATQNLLGNAQYRDFQPFDPSLMVKFCKCFGTAPDQLGGVSAPDSACYKITAIHMESNPLPNKGMLISEASCGRVDLRLSTNVILLNKAQEHAETLIEHLFGLSGNHSQRTYWQRARWKILVFIENKRPSRNEVRRDIADTDPTVTRDSFLFGTSGSAEATLPEKWYKRLVRLHKVYKQQQKSHETCNALGAYRIVSFSQPHARPSFGARQGFQFTMATNSVWCLKNHVEKYREQFGYYPESFYVDRIYCTQANRNVLRVQEKQRRQDKVSMIEVERKFGVGKLAGQLGFIHTKLAKRSDAMTHHRIFYHESAQGHEALSFLSLGGRRLEQYMAC